MTLSAQLASAIQQLRFSDISAQAIDAARVGFIDTIGTMLGGANAPVVQILTSDFAGPAGASRILLGSQTASPPAAALINGTAGHVLDFDDVSLRSHISTVIVPAILAEAEALDLGGTDMLTAYCAGFETWADLVEREADVHNVGGWHTTGVFGAIAAAAASAKLQQLSVEQTAHALNIAASMSSGVMANFGSMMKSIHAGRAAQSGLLAVRMAKSGIDATPDALEHPQGFLRAVSPAGRVDQQAPAHDFLADSRLVAIGLNIKRYPTCYCTHRLIDGLITLKQEHNIAPDDIASVEVRLTEDWATILRNALPQTGLAAKFSAQFAAAAALTSAQVGLTQLDDAYVTRPEIQALMQKVRVATHTEYDLILLGAAVSDSASVTLIDGTNLQGPAVSRALGHADNPLSQSALLAKFADCLAFGKATADPEQLGTQLLQLENMRARDINRAHTPTLQRNNA